MNALLLKILFLHFVQTWGMLQQYPVEFAEPQILPAADELKLELIDVLAACIEPKLGGQLVKRLATAAPLSGLQHLKRVRKSTQKPGRLEVVLCPLPAAAGGGGSAAGERDPAGGALAGLFADLPPAVETLVKDYSLELTVAQVSAHAPRTREQAAEWAAHWPLNWRPPDPGAHPHNAELPAREVEAMRQHMRRAWELAHENARRGFVGNACIIVDPASGRVVAEAADERHRHPLHHAPMRAIAAVAEWQLARWPHAGAKHAAQQGQQQELAVPPDTLDSKRRRLECALDVQPAAAAATAADAAGAAAPVPAGEREGEAQQGPPRNDGSSSSGEQPMQLCRDPGVSASGGPPQSSSSGDGGMADPGPRPYLCTGYDCYLLQEPCVMCAMGLVHSRLRRVVFCMPDARGGALGGGGVKLHAQRSLNHHYLVYRLPLAVQQQG